MKRVVSKSTSLLAMAIISAGAMVLAPAKAHAVSGNFPVNIYVSSTTVNAPTSGVLTGYLDVYVTEGSTVPFQILVTSYTAALSLDSTAGASLIGANITGGNYPPLMPSPIFSETASVSGVSAAASSAATSLGHDPLELFELEYQITPTASGIYNVTFDSLNTSVLDNSTVYSLTIHPGTITVIPAVGNTPTVPEPASLGVLTAGTAGLVMRRRRSA